jgi:hypothetical protein
MTSHPATSQAPATRAPGSARAPQSRQAAPRSRHCRGVPPASSRRRQTGMGAHLHAAAAAWRQGAAAAAAAHGTKQPAAEEGTEEGGGRHAQLLPKLRVGIGIRLLLVALALLLGRGLGLLALAVLLLLLLLRVLLLRCRLLVCSKQARRHAQVREHTGRWGDATASRHASLSPSGRSIRMHGDSSAQSSPRRSPAHLARQQAAPRPHRAALGRARSLQCTCGCLRPAEDRRGGQTLAGRTRGSWWPSGLASELAWSSSCAACRRRARQVRRKETFHPVFAGVPAFQRSECVHTSNTYCVVRSFVGDYKLQASAGAGLGCGRLPAA